MFTKIFLLIFGFNTDLLSVACCAFVCSDFSLLDLHYITTMYYFFYWYSDERNYWFSVTLGLHLDSSRQIQTYSKGVCKRGSSPVIFAWLSLIFLFCSCIWMWNVFTNNQRCLSEVWQFLTAFCEINFIICISSKVTLNDLNTLPNRICFFYVRRSWVIYAKYILRKLGCCYHLN